MHTLYRAGLQEEEEEEKRDKAGGGYAASATGSGAWTGTWCAVLGCTRARRQPVPRIMSI